MQDFEISSLKKLYLPGEGSHKGQNGKLLIIGGSSLFHAAAIWSLSIASKIVDMVFYSSIPGNNEFMQTLKSEFRNGIIVPREEIDGYLEEADAVLIGPGMMRTEEIRPRREEIILPEINSLSDEGEQSYYLTRYLLQKHPDKKWIIDAGALQMLEPEWLYALKEGAILTPHPKEFAMVKSKIRDEEFRSRLEGLEIDEQVKLFASEFKCTVVLKGREDLVSNGQSCVRVAGGNAGMTKGGTGDVLAGLTASLATKNDLFLSAQCASYINKKAGERLYEKTGFYFNASDLVSQIPMVMKDLLL